MNFFFYYLLIFSFSSTSPADWDSLPLTSTQLTRDILGRVWPQQSVWEHHPRESFHLWGLRGSRRALLGSLQSDPRLAFISCWLATCTLCIGRCNDVQSSPGRFNQWPLTSEEGQSCPSLLSHLMQAEWGAACREGATIKAILITEKYFYSIICDIFILYYILLNFLFYSILYIDNSHF